MSIANKSARPFLSDGCRHSDARADTAPRNWIPVAGCSAAPNRPTPPNVSNVNGTAKIIEQANCKVSSLKASQGGLSFNRLEAALPFSVSAGAQAAVKVVSIVSF